MALSDKQARFVEEYLLDLNATQAAIRAGYSERTARSVGAENLTKPDVARAISAAQEIRSRRTQVTATRVLEELAHIGFSNVTHYVLDVSGRIALAEGAPPDALRAVASVKFKTRTLTPKEGPPVVEHEAEFKLWDKNTALANIGKHLGMFAERNLSVNLADLTDEELKRIAHGEDPVGVLADTRGGAA
jgi:phage terminase small subunit